MKPGSVHGEFRILKEGDIYGDRALAFYCKDCGFVELYKEPSTKEFWRGRSRTPELEQAPARAEPQKPQEEVDRKVTKRLVR